MRASHVHAENDVDEDGEGAVALRKVKSQCSVCRPGCDFSSPQVLKNTFKIKWFDPTSQIAFAMGLHEVKTCWERW